MEQSGAWTEFQAIFKKETGWAGIRPSSNFLFQGGVDQRLRRLECRLYTHFGSIKQVRVLGRSQRTVGTPHVAPVALLHVLENRGVVSLSAAGDDLVMAPLRPHFGEAVT